MTALLHLDTHVVVWLAAGEHHRLSQPVLDRITTDTLHISPGVRMELDFLREKGRITAGPDIIVERVASAVGLVDDSTPFAHVMREATMPGRAWHNRDPFDRIIAATALAAGATLATKDSALRACFPAATLWD